jgi:DNA-binding Lrp family transcriptional regulator
MVRSLVLKTFAREYDKNPTADPKEISSSTMEILKSMGVKEEAANKYIAEATANGIIKCRLVPNPDYWEQEFNKRFCFFLMKVKSNKFQNLVDFISENFPDTSWFVCYGDVDAVIRISGDNTDFQLIDEYLDSEKFRADPILVREVPYYYDHPVESNRDYGDIQYSPEQIDQFLQTPCHQLDRGIRESLEKTGIVLGSIAIEDHHSTNRLRAFIVIEVDTPMRPSIRRKFEDSLIKLNEEFKYSKGSVPLTSIFRTYSAKYEYILEMIFDDQNQMDSFTDEIQRLHPSIENSVTYLVAKAQNTPLSATRRRNKNAENQKIVTILEKEVISPRLDDFRAWLPPEFEIPLKNADALAQFNAIAFFTELVTISLDQHQQVIEITKPFLLDYFSGILENKSRRMQDAGLGLIRDVIEPAHKELAKLILDEIFSGNSSEMQDVLKQRDNKWDRWGLLAWGLHVYPRWNENPLLHAIMEIDTTIQGILWSIGNTRNRFAHYPAKEQVVQVCRDLFLNSYQLLEWIEFAKETVSNPKIPLDALRNISSSPTEINRLLQLKSVRYDYDLDEDELLEERIREDKRWKELLGEIEKILQGQNEINERLVELFDELVIPQLNQKEASRLQKTLDYMKGVAGDLPVELLGAILYSLLFGP